MQGINLRFITVRGGREKNSPPGQWDRGNDGNAPTGDFDHEALGQFGTFGAADIRAWTAASETGYCVTTAPLKPRFSAKADISSGHDPISNPNTLGTFDAYFPKGNYFGVLATTGPGPVNSSMSIPKSKDCSHTTCLLRSTGFFSGERVSKMVCTRYQVPGIRPSP
jgi:hypothetical protein